jgi:hypothetical protein
MNSVTSILGARVDIGTDQRSVNTVSVGARINGTCVAVITILSNVLAVSGSRIARVNGARVVIVTVLRISINSVLSITSRDSAKICSRRNRDWSVDTFSSG